MRLKLSVFAITALNMFGCAISYWDAETKAHHIWGFGHLAIKSTEPLEGKQAIIRKSTLSGVAIGIDDGSFGLSIGWDERQRLVIYDESTAITIERPESDNFFHFRIGTYPFETQSSNDIREPAKPKEAYP